MSAFLSPRPRGNHHNRVFRGPSKCFMTLRICVYLCLYWFPISFQIRFFFLGIRKERHTKHTCSINISQRAFQINMYGSVSLLLTAVYRIPFYGYFIIYLVCLSWRTFSSFHFFIIKKLQWKTSCIYLRHIYICFGLIT